MNKGKEGRAIKLTRRSIYKWKDMANHKWFLNCWLCMFWNSIVSKAAPISTVFSVESCFIGATHWWQRSSVRHDGNPGKLIVFIYRDKDIYIYIHYMSNINIYIVYPHMQACSTHFLTWRWRVSPCSILLHWPMSLSIVRKLVVNLFEWMFDRYAENPMW